MWQTRAACNPRGRSPGHGAPVTQRPVWPVLLISACFLVLLSPDPSHATFPGANGKIVFEKDLVVGGDFNAEIFVMDADGGNPVNLTNNPAHDGAPKWSPDGRRIAFVREADIYVMDADGTNVIRLTNDSYWDFAPAWSPDGSQIAFGSNL